MSESSFKTPRFGVAAALVAWGGFTGHLLPALAMAVIAEYPSLSRRQWAVDDKELWRIADLSSLIFALVSVFQFVEYSIHGIYKVLELLPYCLFPLVLSQQFTATKTLPLSALFISLRREVRAGRRPDQRLNVDPPYIVACLLAASSGNTPEYWYLGVAAAVVIALLAAARPARYRLPVWVGAILIGFAAALFTQTGVKATQHRIEAAVLYWINQYAWLWPDPDRAITAIGSIGRLKFSDRIRVRVFPEQPLETPLLLHEANYGTFNLGVWSAKDSQYQTIDAELGSKTWLWSGAPPTGTESLAISTDNRRGLRIIPLPSGASRLTGADIVDVQRNKYGTILIEAKPGQLKYRVGYRPEDDPLPPPLPSDLEIPDNYAEVIAGISAQLQLERRESRDAVRAIGDYFSDNFRYSLVQKGFYPGKTPLAHFLLHERKGHCEYFATSAVLLLRAAGIPARYTVGYVVEEYSALEQAYVARARHAHSWASAYIDGRWLTVDTTPSEWFGLEDDAASYWQTWQDLWAWLSYRYQLMRRGDDDTIRNMLIWLIPPLVVLLAWRLRRYARPLLEGEDHNEPLELGSGSDSDLFELVANLARRGLFPLTGDTSRDFLRRHAEASRHGIPLSRLMELHYKYRFGPNGLTTAERRELKQKVKRYLS
jgi:hypothetical protein